MNHKLINVSLGDHYLNLILSDVLSQCEKEVTIELGLEAKSLYYYKEPTYER